MRSIIASDYSLLPIQSIDNKSQDLPYLSADLKVPFHVHHRSSYIYMHLFSESFKLTTTDELNYEAAILFLTLSE